MRVFQGLNVHGSGVADIVSSMSRFKKPENTNIQDEGQRTKVFSVAIKAFVLGVPVPTSRPSFRA